MKFLLSNIADINFAEVDGRYVYQSTYITLTRARRHQLGMELADLSMTGSLSANREPILAALQHNVDGMEGLPITLHAPFSELYPHAMEQEIRQVAQRSLSEAYNLAEQFGAQVMVAHANNVATIYHPDWFVDHQIEFWKDFLNRLSGRCVIALENTIDETPELMLRIAQGVNNPRFGICLDMGHAHLSTISVETWLQTLAPHIVSYHIHNNDGIRHDTLWYQSDPHNALGDGTLDLEGMLHLAEKLTPNAMVTIETTAIDPSIAWLKEKHFIL